MADHGVTGSPVERAQKALARFHDPEDLSVIEIEAEMAEALEALLATTREDNAPESIAHEVIAHRYGDYRTFEIAVDRDVMHPLGILNMLKDAAAAGLDSREEF